MVTRDRIRLTGLLLEEPRHRGSSYYRPDAFTRALRRRSRPGEDPRLRVRALSGFRARCPRAPRALRRAPARRRLRAGVLPRDGGARARGGGRVDVLRPRRRALLQPAG